MAQESGTNKDVIRFPDHEPTSKKARDEYVLTMLGRAYIDKEFVAVQTTFGKTTGRALEVFKYGELQGEIYQRYADQTCDVLVDLGSDIPGGRLLNEESVTFDAAAQLLKQYMQDKVLAKLHNTVNPNVGLGFGLDIE